MKKLIVVIIAVLCTMSTTAQFKANVDEKFELTSIVFFMAGVPEYGDCAIPSYRRDIIKELAPYDRTEPIHFIRELNIQHAIGYDAVSTTADMLEIKNGKIRLQSQYDIAKIAQYDSRWTPELFAKYIKMLNMFYKQSNFKKFFDNHRPLYELAEKRINEYLAGTAIEWFKSFYGTELPTGINIYISLTNGRHNYAFNSGVLLGSMSGTDSLPAANSSTTRMLVHELGHHYVNTIFNNNWDKLASASEKIFPHVQEQMKTNAYGNAKTMMLEWINNLFRLMYHRETIDPSLIAYTSMEMKRGFIAMERSVKFMDNFYDNRDKYPTIVDFMPQLVGFLNYTADNWSYVQREFETSRPYIIGIYPASGTDFTDAKEIVITFSEPMLGSYGLRGVVPGIEPFDIDIDKIHFDSTKTVVTIPLNVGKVTPGKPYGFRLSKVGFISSRYFELDDNFVDLIIYPEEKNDNRKNVSEIELSKNKTTIILKL